MLLLSLIFARAHKIKVKGSGQECPLYTFDGRGQVLHECSFTVCVRMPGAAATFSELLDEQVCARRGWRDGRFPAQGLPLPQQFSSVQAATENGSAMTAA